MKKATQLLIMLLVAGIASGQQQYKSLLWKITGNGLQEPSYLFGTMHTTDARIVNLGNKIAKKYFDQAPTYAMEIDPGKGLDNIGLLTKLMMGGKYSLAKMMPASEYSFLDSMVSANTGFSLAMFDNVAPVFIMSVFEMKTLGLTDTVVEGSSDVLDVYFYNKAKDAGKKIIGIETVEEQLDALNSLTYQEQADLLVQEIDSFRVNNEAGKDVLKYYLTQDLDSLNASDDDINKPEKFYKALVTDRNVRMATRIMGFIKKQQTFIAIGALHLPGKDGVIELLRKKGFTVEPVSD
ncbi:MAG TPA: TraB/GumN family protein [Chitinophagales bacterium]|nr:TraB/GumN family protein [Chitinophagales bacterium]